MKRTSSLLLSALFVSNLFGAGCGANAAGAGVTAAPRENSASGGQKGFKGKTELSAIALDKVTLVESIPLETEAVLDNADIPNAADLWPELVKNAEKSIDWAMFYASEKEGEALTPVVEGIIQAASKGVKVRIVADGSFVKTYPETLERFERVGIQVKRWDIKSLTHGVMHAKYFVIDGKIAYIGSQNFDYRSLSHVYETGIMVENEEFAGRLTNIFERDFNGADSKEDQEKVRCPKAAWLDETATQVELTSTPPRFQTADALCERQELVSLIGKAKDSVNIQVLQYSPVSHSGKDYFGDLDEALRRAAGKGVRVNLIISDWSTKQPAIDWIKSLSLVPNINVKIITIPQYSKGFIDHSRVAHSKYMTIDNRWSWVGSSNWEKNYFTASRNVGAIIRSIPFTRQLSGMFDKVWASEYCHDVDVTKNYIPPKRTQD